MAYAAVAGVPPTDGLYANCAAPALAVAFGTSHLRHDRPGPRLAPPLRCGNGS